MEGEDVVGYVLGDKKVTVSKVHIATNTGCLVYGITFSKTWAKNFGGRNATYNVLRHPNFPLNVPFKASLMTDEARVLNQILKHMSFF